MKGVILAAGSGSRLQGAGGDVPKCLLQVGGRTLIERDTAALRRFGIDEIIVVVGAQADRVRRTCGLGVHYVENARFAQTNSLYSLWLASPLLREGFVVMNCDVLFHPQMLTDLLTARHEDALLISYYEAGTPVEDEEMKVQVRRGRVVDISKQLRAGDADGENVGIAKFGPTGAKLLIEKLDQLIANGGVRDWAPRAFGLFAAERPLHAVGTRGFPWIEIDFPEDYHRAVDEVLPRIDEQHVRLEQVIREGLDGLAAIEPEMTRAAGRPSAGSGRPELVEGR